MHKSLALLLLPLLATLTGCEAASDAPAPNDDSAMYLFVFSAASAELSNGELSLTDLSPTAVYFSDRPERVAGYVESSDLIDSLKADNRPDSFSKVPPNATLSVIDGEYVEDVVVTLGAPVMRGDTIVFPATVLAGSEELSGGPISLFVDTLGRPATPVSVAGHHRRVRRRHVAHATHHW